MGKPDFKETKKRERNAVRTEIREESIEVALQDVKKI